MSMPQAATVYFARDKTPRADDMTVNALVALLRDGVIDTIRHEFDQRILDAARQALGNITIPAPQVTVAAPQVAVAAPNVTVTSDPLDVNVSVPGFEGLDARLTKIEMLLGELTRTLMLPVTKTVTRDTPMGPIVSVIERRGQ